MQKLRLTHRRRRIQFGSAFDRTHPQGLSPLSSLSFSPSAFHSRIAEVIIPVVCVAAHQLPTRAALYELDGCTKLPSGSEPHRRDWALQPHSLRASRPTEAAIATPKGLSRSPSFLFSGPVLLMGSKLGITLVYTRITSSSFTSNRTSTSRCIRLYGSSA